MNLHYMIIARTPLRITLGGGGTDLPFYYRKNTGFCVTASVKYYTYVSLSKTFYNYFLLKYSKFEKVKNIDNIKHPIFKEIFGKFKLKNYLEATSLADVPSGTGMGSSASFTISLCLALNEHLHTKLNLNKIIELAINSEMKITDFNTGKQDQFGVSFPGINTFTFHPDETVTRKKITISKSFEKLINNNLLLVYSNINRSSKKILSNQKNIYIKNKNLHTYYHNLKNLGYKASDAIINQNLDSLGHIFNEQAEIKNIINQNKMDLKLEKFRLACLQNGASGGRILGAGGGGFFLFYTKDKNKFKFFLKKKNFKTLDVEIENTGPVIL